MEGWILYTHILKDHPNLEAIIIKGVADYADGKKDKQWQLTAAMAAASYTHFQLKQSTALRGMSILYVGYCNSAHSKFLQLGVEAKQFRLVVWQNTYVYRLVNISKLICLPCRIFVQYRNRLHWTINNKSEE